MKKSTKTILSVITVLLWVMEKVFHTAFNSIKTIPYGTLLLVLVYLSTFVPALAWLGIPIIIKVIVKVQAMYQKAKGLIVATVILRKRYEHWQTVKAYVHLSYIPLFIVFCLLLVHELKREIIIPENLMQLFLTAGAIAYIIIAFHVLEQKASNKISKEWRALLKF